MSEVHASLKLRVPDLDLRGHDHCRLHLFSGALTMNEGEIQPGDVYVTDYGHVIVDERIASVDDNFNRFSRPLKLAMTIYSFHQPPNHRPGGTLVEGLSHNG